jgi:hypothetical protein
MKALRGPPDTRDLLERWFWHLVRIREHLSEADRRRAESEIDRITRRVAKLDKLR